MVAAKATGWIAMKRTKDSAIAKNLFLIFTVSPRNKKFLAQSISSKAKLFRVIDALETPAF